jgi:hypothetical protein
VRLPVTPTFVRALGLPSASPRPTTSPQAVLPGRRVVLVAIQALLRRLRSAGTSEQTNPTPVQEPQLIRSTPRG